jgi:type I restriction enzyme, S subunit
VYGVLSKVDEQIEQTEQIIEKTDFLKKGLMQKLLAKGIGHTKFKKTELGEIPEEWKIVKQEDVVSFCNGRAYKLSEWEKTGTPVIRLQNLTGTGSEYYYSNLKLPSKQYVNKGDLLYMWSGSFGPYIWNGSKAIYHYHIWKIECSDKMDKLFMYYLLNKTTELMRSKMNGMAILHITKYGMENQKISLPSLSEQQKIASILSKVDSHIQDNQNYLTSFKNLKKDLCRIFLQEKSE